MVNRLIKNVRVRITRSGYGTYTDKKHQGISADILTRKWEIVLGKEKITIQITVQNNVR